MDRQVTDDDVMSETHKSITQTNRTNKMTSLPRMEMMNDAFRCCRATQVHMEDLENVNLTEIRPSQWGECFKVPCLCSGWMKMRVNNQTKIVGKDKLTITQ